MNEKSIGAAATERQQQQVAPNRDDEAAAASSAVAQAACARATAAAARHSTVCDVTGERARYLARVGFDHSSRLANNLQTRFAELAASEPGGFGFASLPKATAAAATAAAVTVAEPIDNVNAFLQLKRRKKKIIKRIGAKFCMING